MVWPSQRDLVALAIRRPLTCSCTTDGGGVDVIHDGSLTQWAAGYPTHGPNPNRYLWARWGQDGSIYASRLDGRSVVIDRLTSERPATVAVSLPFTVKADAPVGYCAIDGYLAGFSIGPEGVVLIKHDAGPVGHSCPAFPSQAAGETSTTADPWRCASPDGISTELRAEGIAQPGQIDDFYGGSSMAPSDDSTPIAADSTDSGLVVVRTGSDDDPRTGSAPSGVLLPRPLGSDRWPSRPTGRTTRPSWVGRCGSMSRPAGVRRR